MTYAWFVLFQRCASHRTIHMSYRSKTYTWTDVILVKRSMIQVFFYRVTFKLRGHVVRMRPIKVQLSYREWHVTRRAQWYCGTREVSRSIEDRLKFNYHIANDTWPDAHNGIAELEKYPEASNRMWVIVLWYARGRMRICMKEPWNEILSFVGDIWRHGV